MADKKLNEVTKVTDMAYVPVIMSDGSIGQIAKADLATVVAGILGVIPCKGDAPSDYNADDLIVNSVYYGFNDGNSGLPEILSPYILEIIGVTSRTIQRVTFSTGQIYIRWYGGSSAGWTEWVQV